MNQLRSGLVVATLMLAMNGAHAQWEPDLRLTNNPALSLVGGASQKNVAAEGGGVHVVWHDRRDKNEEIYYKRSTDGGVSWGADVRLTNDTSKSSYPSIAVSVDVVLVFWNDNRDGNYEIYAKRSTDGGATWEPDRRLSDGAGWSDTPSAGVSGSFVHVVWADERDGETEIYYKRSTDLGATWGADTRLTNEPAKSNFPSLSVSGSNIHVVWSDYRDTEFTEPEEIYYKRSTDGGTTWGPDIRLTNEEHWSDYPCISSSGPFVHAVWYDSRHGGNGGSIYYKRSVDGGNTWKADTLLTDVPFVSSYASVAASGSIVHVVFDDARDPAGNEVFYKRSTDGGASWGADARLTNNNYSYLPSVAVSGSGIHVVWNDGRDGNTEIYYKRNPTGNTTAIQDVSPSSSGLQFYPNPADDALHVNFASERRAPVSIVVSDFLGVPVFERTEVHDAVSIPTGAIPPGVYFLTVMNGARVERKPFVIIR